MQLQAPNAFDLSRETRATQRLYGIDQKATEVFGRQCLLARRLVERGVRFVQLYHTTGGFQPWDQHSNLRADTPRTPWRPIGPSPACCKTCRRVDCWRRPW